MYLETPVTSVADPDDFGPNPDQTYKKNPIRIRPLKKMRIQIRILAM
jgi:hypothetical protein